jgi:hypothetical protein
MTGRQVEPPRRQQIPKANYEGWDGSRFEWVPHVTINKCDEPRQIEHYQRILVSIGDRATVERLMAMIADLQAQKASLHPEQKQ